MKASTFELIAASIISIVIGWSFCWLNHPEQNPAVESLPTLEYANAHGTPIVWEEQPDLIIDGEDITGGVVDTNISFDIKWPDIEHIVIEGTKVWNIDLTVCGDLTREEMRDLMIWYTFIKQDALWCDELVDKSIELMVSPKLFEK